MNPSVFFPQGKVGRHGHSADSEEREVAQRICTNCVVKPECLEDALLVPAFDQNGVAGGKSADERRLIIRRRRKLRVA